MSIVFTKSAKRLALEKTFFLLVVVIVAGAFVSVFFLKDNVPMPVKILIVLALSVAIWMFKTIFREIIQVLKSGEDWRVEISDTMLKWHSPVPEQMQSFELTLSEIQSIQFIMTRYRNSRRSPKKQYLIESTRAGTVELDPQLCGINPQRVFKALESKGVSFESHMLTEG